MSTMTSARRVSGKGGAVQRDRRDAPVDRAQDVDLSTNGWLDHARKAAYYVEPRAGWVYAWRDYVIPDPTEHLRLRATLRRVVGRGTANAELWSYLGEIERKLDNPQEAMRCFDKALKLDPSFGPAYAWKGEALRDIQRYDEGRAALERAAKLMPREPWVLALLARANGDFRPAHLHYSLPIFAKAIALAPKAGWIRAWRGEAWRRLKKHKEALKDYTFAAKHGSPLSWTVMCRGEVYRKLRRMDLAERDYRLAERMDPNNPWIPVARSEVCRTERRFEDAIKHLKDAVRLSGKAAWAYGMLGRVEFVYAYPKEGLEDMSRSIRMKPLGWCVAWRGEAYRHLGQLKKALADLTWGLKLDPDYGWTWAWRGGTRRRLGDLKGAMEDLNECARAYTFYPWVFSERALVKRAMGDLPGAFDDMEEAIHRDQKYFWIQHPSQEKEGLSCLERYLKKRPRDARGVSWYAQALTQAKRMEEALENFERAEKLLKGKTTEFHGWMLTWWAEALFRAGRGREALPKVQQALRLAPKYMHAHAWHGRILATLGKLKEGRKALEKSLKIFPRTAWAWAWLAEVTVALGDRKAAAYAVDQALMVEPNYVFAKELKAFIEKL
ncbi:MAG: tetratricopeptide repeat protein [Elusimicrobiota bacterium]